MSRRYCCNPLSKPSHLRITKAIFSVNSQFRAKFSEEIGDGNFICSSCHTGLKKKQAKSHNLADCDDVLQVEDKILEGPGTVTHCSDSDDSDSEFVETK